MTPARREYLQPMPRAATASFALDPELAPRPLDLVMGLGLFAAIAGEAIVAEIPGSTMLLVAVAAVQGAALPWRRQLPRSVAIAQVSANILPGYFGTPNDATSTFGLIGIVVAMFALGRYGFARPQQRAGALGVVVLAFAIAASVGIYQSGVRPGEFVFMSLFLVAPVAFGRAMSVSHRDRDVAERTAAELAEASARLREQAIHEERERIARELHDVIAHSVSLMGLQAGAARKVLPAGNAAVETSLRSIEVTGRDTLGELRRMLGVMREASGGEGLSPQPGLADLPELIEQARASGVQVRLDRGDGLEVLSPGVDLAAFRIVQEALTNSVRHAAGLPVDVWAGVRAGQIELRIVSRGAAPDRQERSPSGHGIVGMQERAALYGGTLSAGFEVGAGFVVAARLPAENLAGGGAQPASAHDGVTGR